jgi:hypothetical protein
MAAITLSTIPQSTIRRVAAGRNDNLLQFADDIVALNEAGILESTIASARKPKPAAKPRKAAKPAAKTVDPKVGTGNLVMTLSGKLMKGEAGTITKGQRRNLARFGITAVDGLSMAQASDIYFNLKAAA